MCPPVAPWRRCPRGWRWQELVLSFDSFLMEFEDQSLDTLGCFFKILLWSFKWLQRGQWPDRDWEGALQLDKVIGKIHEVPQA